MKKRPKCRICKKRVNYCGKKFCSLKCSGIAVHKVAVKRGSGKAIKNLLRKKYKNKCQRCGWHKKNKQTGIVPLELHHKDGNCRNNSRKNVQLLCPNCHSLTENYKARNKGKGKRIRYRYVGLSFNG